MGLKIYELNPELRDNFFNVKQTDLYSQDKILESNEKLTYVDKAFIHVDELSHDLIVDNGVLSNNTITVPNLASSASVFRSYTSDKIIREWSFQFFYRSNPRSNTLACIRYNTKELARVYIPTSGASAIIKLPLQNVFVPGDNNGANQFIIDIICSSAAGDSVIEICESIFAQEIKN